MVAADLQVKAVMNLRVPLFCAYPSQSGFLSHPEQPDYTAISFGRLKQRTEVKRRAVLFSIKR
jgi:hypothetical protein